MLGAALTSMERMEHMLVQVTIMEQVAWLHALRLMSRKTAITLLQLHADQWCYYLMLGRQVNFRPSDKSSIWKSRDPAMYFERLSLPDGDEAVARVDQLDPLIVFATHDGLSASDVYFDAFDRFRAVNIVRHPLDLVYSWYTFGWGRRWDDRRAFIMTLCGPTGRVPYFAAGWEREYESLPEMDRVIRGIWACTARYGRMFAELPSRRRAQVFRVSFERFVTDPDPILKRLGAFLDTTTSASTPQILGRERIPRPDPGLDRSARWDVIAREASPACRELVEGMVEEYERIDFD